MELKRKKLMVFDMDGTILNTLEDLTDAMNYTLRSCGYPERTLSEVRSFVGNGIYKLVERAAPEGTDDAEWDRMYRIFMPYYQEHCYDKTKPYTGIPELMARLRERGALIAVVSNKADAAVQELCERFFPGLVDAAVGERPGSRRKPAPDSVFAVLESLHIAPEDAVYIGDSDVDLETAVNSGLDHIIVTWGFRDRPFLEERGARVFADAPEEVARLAGYEN